MKKFTAIVLSGILAITAFAANTGSVYAADQTKSRYTGKTYIHKDSLDADSIVHGIDVSKWNGDIDWNKIKADGIEYVFIRCGHRKCDTGVIESDIKYKQNVEGATKAGLKVGLYIFSQAITEKEAINEAKYMINMAKGYDITMPLVMDFEYNGDGCRLAKAHLSNKKRTNICDAFLSYVDEQGYVPMLYANYSMLTDDLDNASLSNKYKIWIARYNKETEYSGDYDFWQYSSEGKVKGNGSSAMDMNFWYNDGSLEEKKVKAESVSIKELESNEIAIGETIKLNATILPTNTTETYRWTSSNPEVAYVSSDGKVRGVTTGSTTIKITTSKGLSAKIDIKVKNNLNRYKVILDSKNKSYAYTGGEIKPRVTVRTKYNQIKSVKTKENVYLRTGPDSTFISLACVPKGTKVNCIGSLKVNNKKWYVVKYKEDGEVLTGYTCADYYSVLTKQFDTLADNNYSCTYVDNIEIGKGTVEVNAVGSCVGKLTKEFTIGPKEINDLKVSKNTTKYIKLKFKGDDRADGYKLYRANKKNGKYKLVKNVKNANKKVVNTATKQQNVNGNTPNANEYKAAGSVNKNVVIKDTKVKNGYNYYYKVISYVNIDGSNITSPYSNVTKGTCKFKKSSRVKLKCNSYIRKRANANSKAVKLAYKKSTYRALEIVYDNKGKAWVKIKYKNARGKYRKGYVLKSLVKLK